MKINKPHSPLPYKTEIVTDLGNANGLYIQDKSEFNLAEVYHASDSEYLTWAANNIQKAVKLVKEARDTLVLCTLIDKSNLSSQTVDKLEEFLTKINKEF